MKLKNIFKMLAVALLICFSVQSISYAMDYPEYDGIEYNAAFDGMASVIYNNNGVLVDTYDGSPFKERNTWVKFGDGKLKYEDIVNNQELKDYYDIESKFYINFFFLIRRITKKTPLITLETQIVSHIPFIASSVLDRA